MRDDRQSLRTAPGRRAISSPALLRFAPKRTSSEQRGRHRGHLFAFGGARDRDAGLVEDGLGAGVAASRLLSSSVTSTLYWPLGIVGDLARRGRGQDQRVVGRVDRRETMGEGAEAALIGIAARGVDHDELGAGALLLHHVEHGFDADARRGGRRLPSRSRHRPGSCSSRGRPGRRSRRRTASPRNPA